VNAKQEIVLKGTVEGRGKEVLTSDALDFVARLHREFNATREDLLRRRQERQRELSARRLPDFLTATSAIRGGSWRVAETPRDLRDRRVEITGPAERKMVINALNSGAKVFMADFEDALSPTWDNLINGQVNLTDAIERTIEFNNPDGRVYRLNPQVATLLVRPRGWHLTDRHLLIDGQPVSGSLMDFGLYFFHNAQRLLEKGSGPYFYLPKMESHLEARLWNEVFNFAQDRLGIARGTIRATVLIETILAAFEMEEILYELRDHSAGLNAGRWDYLFSIIKKFRDLPEFVLVDRNQLGMATPFMRAYAELLVKSCHRHGAHAIGGMAAFVPNRRDPEVNERAFAQVRADKERESGAGFDGTWVAHPDLVPVAMEVFDRVIGERPNQVERTREDVDVSAGQLLDVRVADGRITEAGLRNDVSVGIQYLESWLRGIGAVTIFNLMEDAATAEIARSQIWQWIHNHAHLAEGAEITADLVRRIEREELERIKSAIGAAAFDSGKFGPAVELFERVALGDNYEEFLTVPAYPLLD
jgi:malate synthase